MKIKNVFFILIFTLVVISVSAQSKYILGGNIYYKSIYNTDSYMYPYSNKSSSFNQASTNFGLNVSLHYLTNKHFAVGGELGFDNNIAYNYSTRDFLVYFKPSVMYIQNITDNLIYTPKLYIGGGIGKYKPYSNYNNDMYALTAGVDIFSFDYKLSNKVAINLSFGDISYNKVEMKDDCNGEEHFNFDLTNNLRIGIRFFL